MSAQTNCAAKETPESQSEAAKKPVNLPSLSKLKINWAHIYSGHTSGGSRNPMGRKTVFYGLTLEQVRRAVTEAYMNCSKIRTVGDRVLVEGFSPSYGFIIRMWINLTTFVMESAFPR